MAQFKIDGDFKTAKATGQPRISLPFASVGDSETVVVEQDYTALGAYFSPLAQNTQYALALRNRNVTTYLVDETQTQDLGGGVVKWSRVFASIPKPRVEFQQFAYTFPGMSGGTLYAPVAVTGSSKTAGQTVLTAAGSGLTEGDSCLIYYQVIDRTGIAYNRKIFRPVLAAAGNDVTVKLVTDLTGNITFVQLQKVDASRDPITRSVMSTISYDYFLAGITAGIKSYRDISIIEPDDILDSDGKVTNTYTADSLPTVLDYKAQIAAEEWIVAEASTLKIWKGLIYERATRYVKAQ